MGYYHDNQLVQTKTPGKMPGVETKLQYLLIQMLIFHILAI